MKKFNFQLNIFFSIGFNMDVLTCFVFFIYIIHWAILTLSLKCDSFIGLGNHKEDSPFLNNVDAARKNDFYDRNLALFEVCLFKCYALHTNLQHNILQRERERVKRERERERERGDSRKSNSEMGKMGKRLGAFGYGCMVWCKSQWWWLSSHRMQYECALLELYAVHFPVKANVLRLHAMALNSGTRPPVIANSCLPC